MLEALDRDNNTRQLLPKLVWFKLELFLSLLQIPTLRKRSVCIIWFVVTPAVRLIIINPFGTYYLGHVNNLQSILQMLNMLWLFWFYMLLSGNSALMIASKVFLGSKCFTCSRWVFSLSLLLKGISNNL